MKKSIFVLFLILPTFIIASDFVDVLNRFSIILVYIKNIIFALALIGFFYGLMKFIFSVGNGKEEGKSIMVWGIIALFVMFSIWGIIAILQHSFSSELENNNSMFMPQMPR